MKEDLLTRYRKALEGLTAGGSEYYNDPERCAKEIQEKLIRQGEMIKKLIIERNKLRNKLKGEYVNA